MKAHIFRIVKHPLISGSSIIFAGSFIVNILNYIFNLAMGRLLSVSEYGLLISLISLVTLLTLFQSSLTTLFAKFAAKYAAKDDSSGLSSLVWTGTKITFTISTFFGIVLIFLIQPISNFLHIHNTFLVVIMLSAVIFSILYSLPVGVLQGKLKFIFVSIINIFGSLIKVIFGLLLVGMGFGLLGAGISILFAFFIPFIIAFLYMIKAYKINVHKDSNVKFIEEFKKISGPFLIASIAITVLQSTDVIFARHFLSNVAAGQYAALSVMGKAIFYVTSPIFFVFFPLIAQKKELNQGTRKILFFVLSLIFFGNLLLTVFYTLFPGIILGIFFPQMGYQTLKPYLGIYAVYILIFSLAFLLQNYLLSIGKVGVYKISTLCLLIYILLVYNFHQNIFQIIATLIASSFLLLILLLVYYIRDEIS